MICNSFAVSAWSSSASIQTSICSFCIRILILSNKKLVFFFIYIPEEKIHFICFYMWNLLLWLIVQLCFSPISNYLLSNIKYDLYFHWIFFVFSLCLFLEYIVIMSPLWISMLGNIKDFLQPSSFEVLQKRINAQLLQSSLTCNTMRSALISFISIFNILFPYKLIILYTKIQNKWLDWLFFPVISDKMYNFFVCSFCIFVKWPYDEKSICISVDLKCRYFLPLFLVLGYRPLYIES